ncbi:enoyl-(Acyl carrier protein) reductase [Hirsutella rhossiliensis]|uniref:Enoyl-(Acyl carrier protein) reductase domain-containing protein n=1 Tax=Hirsutella rhossiliensis TaxID=111463 RepID=A0A9P8MRC8_9HYPO|nr:enoyl-(Acyl carrier protein) reductase domain-containing protein [Hirsutella rhossiliensis]KAH0960838.1 enoyl-(Acyl carrier protein) reductase domain-containing protein [Hirsutella rhossiliensis]
MPPPLRLAGLHCAIVGGTGVIGASIAKAFAHQGAAVTILGRRALQLRPQLEPELPPCEPDSAQPGTPSSHRFICLDVGDHADIKSIFAPSRLFESKAHPPRAEAAEFLEHETVGPLDVLVNCAGVAHTSLLKRTSDYDLAGIVDTNLVAAMVISKYAMIRPHGSIINVSSLMANKGGLGATAYAASKAGLVAFTRALSLEMAAKSVRVNALLPGWVDSQMWTDLKPELKEAYLKATPLGRVGDPSEVAHAALFLAANRFANNCVLNLDGGLSAS